VLDANIAIAALNGVGAVRSHLVPEPSAIAEYVEIGP
jgi:hypothetical protein